MDRRADVSIEPLADISVEPLTVTALERVRTGRGSGARARLATATWLLGLTGVVGLAVAGQRTEPGSPEVPTAVVGEPAPAAATPTPPRPEAPRPSQLRPVVRPTLGDDGLLGGLVFAGH